MAGGIPVRGKGAGVNLWDPQVGMAVWAVLGTAFLLGMIHGVTPDEHTWPITFSYAVGGYSSRAGMRSALLFSLTFALQRAIASELAYLALGRYLSLGSVTDYIIYIVVGVAMVWAARYIRGGRLPWHLDLHLHSRLRSSSAGPAAGHAHHHGAPVHVHTHGNVPLAATGHWSADKCPECGEPSLRDPRPWMPAVHGFIAGWGVGAFATIIYTVLAPSMPSAALGWLPGAVFGLGTMAVQVLIGTSVGWLVRRAGAGPEAARAIGLVVAARTLGVGGAAFVLAGLFGLAFPRLASAQLSTGVAVHNLDTLGLPILLVMVSVGLVGIGSLVQQVRVQTRRPAERREEPHAGREVPATLGSDESAG